MPFAWPPPLSTCVIVAVTYFSCSSPRGKNLPDSLSPHHCHHQSAWDTLALHAQHAGGVQWLLLEVLPKSRCCVRLVHLKRKSDGHYFPMRVLHVRVRARAHLIYMHSHQHPMAPTPAAQSLWTLSPTLACPSPQHPTPPQRVFHCCMVTLWPLPAYLVNIKTVHLRHRNLPFRSQSVLQWCLQRHVQHLNA